MGGDPRKGPFPVWLLISAAALAIVAAAALATMWFRDPQMKANTLTFEAAKVLMQVLGVVFLGGVLSFAVAAIQVRHQAALAARQASDQAAAALLQTQYAADEAALERKDRESERRDVEGQDARKRLDDFRRELLGMTITNYNAIKKARRRLRAAGYREGSDSVRGSRSHSEAARATCTEVLEGVIDTELEFERLAKLAPLAEVPHLEGHFQACERYLKKVFGDFEASGRAPDPGDQSNGLAEFVACRHTPQGQSFGEFARATRGAVTSLHEALVQPLRLGEGDHQSQSSPNA